MSNPTTPEVRINKLGVPVTKHVLAGTKPASSKLLPAPALPTPPATQVEVTSSMILDLLKERGCNVMTSARIVSRLDDMEPETLEYVHAAVRDYPKESVNDLGKLFSGNTLIYEQMVSCVARVAIDVRKMMPADTSRNTIEDLIFICEQLRIKEMYAVPSDFHLGLIKAEKIALDIGLDSPERKLIPHQRAMVLESIRMNLDTLEPAARVVCAYGRVSDGALAGADTVLDNLMGVAKFANQYPDRHEDIVRIITERDSYDPDFIQSVLESDVPVLEEGML